MVPEIERVGKLKSSLTEWRCRVNSPDNLIVVYLAGEFLRQWHKVFKVSIVNIKRIFGTVLTILGIIGLVYAAILFVNNSGKQDFRGLVTYGVLGIIFFASGIGLVRTIKDEA